MALLWLFFVLVLVLDAVSSITSTEHDGTLWSRRPEPTFTRLMLDQSSLGYLPGAAEVAGTLLDAPGTIAAGRFASRRRRS